MPRPTLEEIFNSQPQAEQRPSLEQIFSQPSQQADSYQAPQYEAPAQRPSLNEIFGQPSPSQQQPQQEQNGIMNVLGNVWDVVKEPASTALEALSYLDKPRGALAGAVKAYEDNTPLLEGAQKGWNENTSWKDTFNQDWVKENPKTAALAGLATDIVADPLWFITPAKVAKGVEEGSKAIGLTDKVINPAVDAFKATDFGKNTIAKAEDFAGVNRLADTQAEFKSGRATDQVLGQDIIDEINKFKEVNPSYAEDITRYVESKPRELSSVIPSEAEGIIKAADDGKLAEHIKEGIVTKDQAFNALRDAEKDIPDYLLQEHQRLAKAEQFSPGKVIPDYRYRDEILNAIPDNGVRKAIETIGNKIVEANQKMSSDLLNSGRLSAEQYVKFQEGSHLRRSFAQYETPEKYLEAVRKNGTAEEWQRVYSDYQTAQKSGTGFGATHKVNMKDFTGRQVLSEATLKKMGVINDPAYKVMDTLNRGSKTLREDEFLSKVSSMFGKSEEEAAKLSRDLPKNREYVPVPDGKAYGDLAGKWIPADVAKQVMGTLGQKPDRINETFGKILSWWKVSKLANPASVMRNLYSGIPMANVFGKVPLQEMPKYMAKVSQAFLDGGKNNPLIRELRMSGSLDNVWSKQELANIIGENPTGIKKAADFGMKAFGAPDMFSRAVVFAYHRDHGMSIKDAVKMTNKAQFDYSNAPEWVNWLSKTGAMPFAKFPYFAIKGTAKAAYENPAQVTKYMKAQNQVNNQDRENIMPDYMKARTLLPTGESTRMVNGKPQKVQNNLDLSYILPFANDLKFGNPLVDALVMSRTGQNGLGQQVIKPGMTDAEKAKAWANFAYNAIAPSIPLPGNYAGDKLANAYNGRVDSKGRQYDMTDAVKQTLLGLKNVPINEQEMYVQKITALTNEQRNIQTVMSTIARDKSISTEQKKERLAEHASQLKELGKQIKAASDSWNREKKKGNY